MVTKTQAESLFPMVFFNEVFALTPIPKSKSIVVPINSAINMSIIIFYKV